ncbi:MULTISPECIES: RDD family protein [unclassified Blastococcus]
MEPDGPGTWSAVARWRAAGWDYVVILGWLAVLAAVAAGARLSGLVPEGGQRDPVDLVIADLGVFAATVLPVWLYFTLREAGARHAGPGKERAGLRVAVDDTTPQADLPAEPVGPGIGRAAWRNAVKWLPWQLAHLAVARAILGSDEWVVMGVSYALSLLLPLLSLGMAWRDPRRRALHDRLARTVVVPAALVPRI